VLTFVEVMKVYVETALSDSYPRIKGIRSRANFIRNIVSRYLTRPEPNLADYLALAAALMATVMFGLTGISLTPAFSRGTYFGGIGTNVLQATSTPLRLGGNTYPKDYF
jgi:hypothetical protein